MKLTVGTRGSKLAMAQTTSITKRLNCVVDVQRIVTRGDKIQDVALARLEGKAFFTREIDEALLRGDVDFAVHSFKDVPTELPEGLAISIIPARESPLDAIVSNHGGLKELPQGASVGTASLRRQALLRKLRPDLEITDLRGNLDTRVRKARDGELDAVVVAEAGLRRLGHDGYHALDPSDFIPAPCQGALAITTRKDDCGTIEALSHLEDAATRAACECERGFLTALQGGCQIPAGAYTERNAAGDIRLTGFISSVDGKRFYKVVKDAPGPEAVRLAEEVAGELLGSGGCDILAEIRRCD